MDAESHSALSAALDQLWARFLPQMRERVAVLEAAAAACAEGRLNATETEAAHAAAHKLAGSLGSFNLTHGTVLARELELLYSVGDVPGRELGPQLTAHAAELRTLIEHR